MADDDEDDGPVSVLRFRMTYREYLIGQALAGAMAASPYRRDWQDAVTVAEAVVRAADLVIAAIEHD